MITMITVTLLIGAFLKLSFFSNVFHINKAHISSWSKCNVICVGSNKFLENKFWSFQGGCVLILTRLPTNRNSQTLPLHSLLSHSPPTPASLTPTHLTSMYCYLLVIQPFVHSCHLKALSLWVQYDRDFGAPPRARR